MTIDELRAAHNRSFRNRTLIEKSTICGCFYCKRTCSPSEIKEYVRVEETALCPHCGIDALVGDASGLPVSEKGWLSDMHNYWFTMNWSGQSE